MDDAGSTAQRATGWHLRALELLGASAIAVEQPILDLFGGAATTFVIRGTGRAELVLFALVVALAVPALLLGIEALVDRVAPPGVTRWVHAGAIALLLGLFAVQLATGPLTLRGLPATGLAVACALAVLARFDGSAALRQGLRLLAIGTPAFVLLFLFGTPVRDVLLPPEAEEVELVEGSDAPPVVLIVFDALPLTSLLDDAGTIDEDLFPGFAALADDSTWFRSASTVSGSTFTAVPAILTGRRPTPTEMPHWSTHPDSLLTYLAATHELNAHETVTSLCPPSLSCTNVAIDRGGTGLSGLLADAVDLYRGLLVPDPDEEGVAVLRSNEASGDRLAQIDDFVESLGRSTRPRLDLLHVVLPHRPWQYLPDGTSYEAPTRPDGAGLFEAWQDERAAEQGRAQHLLQLQLVDRQLQRIVDRLRDLDLWDEAVVVVTADHGESFAPGISMRIPDRENAAEIMWVPLFVKVPGQRDGTIDGRPAESVDVLPTIADAVGLALPFAVDGTSLLGAAPPPGPDVRRLLVTPWMFEPPDEGDELLVDGTIASLQVVATAASRSIDDIDELFALGPYGELVGRTIEELPPASGEPLRLDLEIGGDGDLPPYLRGRLDAPFGGDLAIALDGRIVTVLPVGTFQDDQLAWGLLPPSADRTGRLTVLAIAGDPALPTVRPVEVG